MKRQRVLVLLLPGVHLQDMAGPVQVLYEAGGYDLSYCSPLLRVRSAQGLDLSDLAALPEVERSDLILIPGTASSALDRLQVPRGWLREAQQKGARLASICSGAFALGRAGLPTVASAPRTGSSSVVCARNTPRRVCSTIASSSRTAA
jgi:transcriptional regulator GlxA family with amidase domain